MYIHTLHCEKKHCCCYCLQTFKGKKILKPHINKRFKINGKQMIQMPKEGEQVKSKNYERKIKSPFMVYTDFESILMLKISKKQNPDESCAKKYQNHDT